ncbi:SH3 domain-containing protein [Phreatobacter aquaticus]|uniref:SH3 domain-containing protein n=1 Tax=Phreatobacter aquaticus TaxID=2570229 RepID=A0A4D7QQQ4_9HYPH|nr:SH3 domain-containing protein [Phreatobacter aquaticus]QCK86442.1 SH3 domain-containing protein [Phreatobacter aquaticus]
MRFFALALAATTLSLGLGSGPAAATSAACAIKTTSDGFVALRAEPSPSGRLLVRMAAGHTVAMHHASPGQPSRRGQWVKVSHWADGELRAVGAPRGRTGWVHEGLLDDCG